MNTYCARTGLENERGERVEAGENLPEGFVPEWQLEHWLAQGDVIVDPSGPAIIAPTTEPADARSGGE